MSARTETLRLDDHVHEVLEERLAPDLRFRASLITSAAVHVGIALLVVFGPLLFSRRLEMPITMPVRVVNLQEVMTTRAEPTPPAEEPEPEPPAVVVTEPEPVPRNLEALERERREAEMEERRRQEEAARRAAEERRRREAERRAEEERRRREEEERLKNQSARRSSRRQEQRTLSQSAERGSIEMAGGEQATGLTEEEFEFSYYLNLILDQVSRHWSPPASGAYGSQLSALVYFRIDRSGRVFVGPEVRRSSGNALFDQAAVRAVRNARFAPLPQAYEGSALGVHLQFKQQ